MRSISRRRIHLRRAAVAIALIAPLALGGFAAATTAGPAPAPVATQSATSAVHFADYFNTRSPAWTFYNRSGHVTGGRLVIDGGYLPGARPSRDGWAMTHVGDSAWRDYKFSTTFDTSNLGGSPSEVHQSMLYFRVINNGKAGLGTYYLLTIWDPGQPDPTVSGQDMSRGLVQLFRINSGAYTQLQQRTFSNTVNGSNTATVCVRGGRISLTVNGRQVFSIVDPKPLHYGGVGVGQIWETNGSFDNVQVTSLR